MNDELTIMVAHDAPRCLVLRLEGILDGRAAPGLMERCVPAGQKGRRLVLNLASVTAITSSGIGALLALVEAYEEEPGKVRIASPSPAVRAVIRLLNLDQFLIIDESEAQAIDIAEAA